MTGYQTLPSFLGPQEVSQRANQSDNSFGSYHAYKRQTDGQQRRKHHFFLLRGHKTLRFYENLKSFFHIKPIPSHIMRMEK